MSTAVERMMKEYEIKKRTMCEYYETVEERYPPFTAEKQIELLNFLYENGIELIIFPYGNKMQAIVRKYEGSIYMPIGGGYNFTDKFANLLRQLKPHINNAKVKEILEG